MLYEVITLYRYTSGQVMIGGHEVALLTKKDMVYNMGLVSQSPFIFDGTIEENLRYACDAVRDGDQDGPVTLDEMITTLQQVGMFTDILRFGLNMVLEQTRDSEVV